jgi:hypothetical protein
MAMRRFKSERGAAGVGALIAVVVFLFIAYEAKQFGPHVVAQFQFEDAVVEIAKFSRNKPAESVQQEVLAKAAELGLPVSREMVKVARQPQNTRIEVYYDQEAEWLPGKPYKWTVEVLAESVLF